VHRRPLMAAVLTAMSAVQPRCPSVSVDVLTAAARAEEQGAQRHREMRHVEQPREEAADHGENDAW